MHWDSEILQSKTEELTSDTRTNVDEAQMCPYGLYLGDTPAFCSHKQGFLKVIKSGQQRSSCDGCSEGLLEEEAEGRGLAGGGVAGQGRAWPLGMGVAW